MMRVGKFSYTAIIQGPRIHKCLRLNCPIHEYKPKTWLSNFVNTSPEVSEMKQNLNQISCQTSAIITTSNQESFYDFDIEHTNAMIPKSENYSSQNLISSRSFCGLYLVEIRQ